LKSIDLGLLFKAAILFPVIVFIGCEKWRQIIKDGGIKATPWETIRSFLGGAAMGLLTPGRVGELGRVIFLKKEELGSLVGIAILDKVIDLNVTLWLAIYGSFVVFDGVVPYLFLTVGLLGGGFLTFPHMIGKIAEDMFNGKFLVKKLGLLIEGMNAVRAKTVLLCIFYRFLASMIDMIQYYFLISAFVPIKLDQVFVVYPLIILTNLLQLTVGNIGVREGVAAILLSRYGIPPAVAVSASLLLFMLNSLIPGLLGVVFLPDAFDGMRKKKRTCLCPKH